MTNQLTGQLSELARLLGVVRLPLPLKNVESARQNTSDIAAQIHDYLLPRLDNLDAPILAVVGGSTGSGKSTLVNSIIGTTVSAPGVIRPTTKAPVLVCHPSEAHFFTDGRILPTLVRTHADTVDSRALKVVTTTDQSAGVALLDAPDIDSIDATNRELANQLLQAADLWLFVTTAARYADAVPWGFLKTAAERGVSVAVILDRVPPEALADVPVHLRQLLTDRGLPAARLFVIPEVDRDAEGLLPADTVAEIKAWLQELADEAETRRQVVLATLLGSITALPPRVNEIADQVQAQRAALDQLRHDAEGVFARTTDAITRSAADGTLLRGEVLARWQDFVGTGEFMRAVEQKIGWFRDRFVAALKAEPPQADKVETAIESGLESLIVDQVHQATATARQAWLDQPAGRAILANHPTLGQPATGLEAEVNRLVHDWQAAIFDLVANQGMDRRAKARYLALGVNGLGAALIVFIFATTGGLTGAEVGVAGGAAVLAQRLLEAVFGDDAVRKLAAQAKQDLDERVAALLRAERERFTTLVDLAAVPDCADDLRDCATELAKADVHD